MSDAEKYWNTVYQESPYKKGKAPTPFLESMVGRLQKGKVLDIGMGEGQNAVYMSQKGFNVKGFDISSVAIEHAQKLARDTGVQIDAQRTDMDFFLMGLMEYDTIVMTYFRPTVTRYYSEMIRGLKQGGTLLVESVTVEDMKEPIGRDESYRNWFFQHNELLRGLAGLRVLFYQESMVDGKHVVQCLAKKPMDKDAAKYNLFDMQVKQGEKGDDPHKKLAEAFFKKS